jgi:hypothetical protein
MTVTVKRILHVDITDTAYQWELYTDNPMAEVAAEQINRAFENYVNQGMNKDRVRQMMYAVLENYSDVGAYDSEPVWHMEFILDKIFGD